MKVNSILAILIIVIMMISVFASLSASAPNEPNIVQPVVNNSTDSPSPTGQQTGNPTKKPANTPGSDSDWNPLSIITTIIDPTPKPAGLIESNPNVSVQFEDRGCKCLILPA
jgi:hypothetical protein